MVKCNYSERLNYLQAQTCNAHLCHPHAIEGNHFEQQSLQIENQWDSPRELLKVQSLLHSQHLVHKIILPEPTQSHSFMYHSKNITNPCPLKTNLGQLPTSVICIQIIIEFSSSKRISGHKTNQNVQSKSYNECIEKANQLATWFQLKFDR